MPAGVGYNIIRKVAGIAGAGTGTATRGVESAGSSVAGAFRRSPAVEVAAESSGSTGGGSLLSRVVSAAGGMGRSLLNSAKSMPSRAMGSMRSAASSIRDTTSNAASAAKSSFMSEFSRTLAGLPKTTPVEVVEEMASTPGAGAAAPFIDAATTPTMGAGTVLGTMAGMGMAGGVMSHMTGGEFGQGAMAGVFIGAGAGLAHKGLGSQAFRKALSASGDDMGKASSALNNLSISSQTVSARASMFGGAALGGAVFGGNRNRHQRGFNNSRGNRF